VEQIVASVAARNTTSKVLLDTDVYTDGVDSIYTSPTQGVYMIYIFCKLA
jgi:hypothetical protein